MREQVRVRPGAKAARRRAPQPSASRRVGGVASLQQTAGNRAVAQLVAVQRHNSYEHQLLGDTKPGDLKQAEVLVKDEKVGRLHLLEDEFSRSTFFAADARKDPTAKFPDVRWIKLGKSELFVSSGELSAMGDYLPDPTTIDTLPPETLIPILQRMRQVISRSIYDEINGGTAGMKREDAEAEVKERNDQTTFKGAVGNDKAHLLPEEVKTIEDLDAASASLGPDSQKGLMGRNACHFAPFSWERWTLYHNQALEEAREAHAARFEGKGKLSIRSGAVSQEHERKAWVTNGYSNHFLQDSFAAGHLINKTLVMQWFAEYIEKHHSFGERAHFGLPSDKVLTDMSTANQPELADQRAYHQTRFDTTANQDHAEGQVATDPQTALERGTTEGRIAGAGVHGGQAALDEFAAFLNSAYVNLSANDIHDQFNEAGLRVRNGNGVDFLVGGDGTLMKEDDAALDVTIEADAAADKAITDTVKTGTTPETTEKIFKAFPQSVHLEGKTDPVGLEQWNDSYVKQQCDDYIFPKMAEKMAYKGARLLGDKLKDGKGPGGGIMTPP